jgi:hypothetical protein
MQVIVHGESKYIPVSTVTFKKGKPGETYPFKCNSCGNTHTIIEGQVVRIYPFLEPGDEGAVITSCHSCHVKYVFQEDKGENLETFVKVLLAPKQDLQIFYCWLGGGEVKSLNKILEYDKLHAYSPRLRTSVKIPLTIRCTNDSCKVTYRFNQFS